MTRDEVEPAHDLTKRSWIRASGVGPLVFSVTFAGACAVVALTDGMVARLLLTLVILAGVAAWLLLRARRGAEHIHRRVTAARLAWAESRHDAHMAPDGPADPRDVSLALPMSWEVVAARSRLTFVEAGRFVRAETWALKAAGGSKRAPDWREVTRVDAETGDVQVWVPLGLTADPLIVKPAWARSPDGDGPVWLPAVRDRVARHTDILSSLTIGDDRVVLFSLDDPRPETTVERARLVTDVADIISGRMG